MINGTNAIDLNNNVDIESELLIQGQTNEIDGISILVEMAKTGKVDPWNIDIVDVTDKYLSQIFKIKANNLRLTGRTLLFAAILLKLKSNILEGISVNQFEENQAENDFYDNDFDDNEDDIHNYEEELPRNNVISIDEVLERRTSIRLNRNRVVTLKDLIRQLKFYEELDKKRTLKNTLERHAKRRVKSYANFTADDIINIAHDEYIEKSVEVLHENLVRIFETEEKVELDTLTLLGMAKISAYIALLFLSVNENYDLVQDEFYSDLYVVKRKDNLIAEVI